jgi:hypothetical protein
VQDFSYGDLYRLTDRFANVLRQLGSARVTACSHSPGASPRSTSRLLAR